MKKTTSISDAEFERLSGKLIAFQEANPDLGEALAMWMADRATCEVMYPEAAEIFKREMAEF